MQEKLCADSYSHSDACMLVAGDSGHDQGAQFDESKIRNNGAV